MKVLWLCVAASLALPAASRGGDGTPSFEGYLRFRRIPPEKAQGATRDEYLARRALAEAIERTRLLDEELCGVELDEFRKEMLISRYFEKFLGEKVTEETGRAYYLAHLADFEERKVRVAHLVVRTKPGLTEVEREALRTKAQEAASLVRTGEDLQELSASYADDLAASPKGGDPGWLKEGAVSPSFSAAVFALKPGEVAGPLETPLGFHVVKLLEGPVAARRPYEAVAGDIRYRLRNEAKRLETARLLASVPGGASTGPNARRPESGESGP